MPTATVTVVRPQRPAAAPTRHRDTPDTAESFARFARAGDGPERERLLEELTRAWLPMAHRIASGFRDKGEATEDLRQVAAVGLVKAIRRFDPARGAFEPYAVPTIRGELRRHFRDRMWDVRVPRRVQELRNKVRAAYVELACTSGRPRPGVADLARHTLLSEAEVREGLAALESYSALSLDACAGDGDRDGTSLADVLGEPDGGYDLVVDRESVKRALRALPSRERAILYLRFFEDWPQHRIADRLGISQMHVSRLLTRTCARVREETVGEALGAL
ncbi:SigB/SigF/SigG family RNA polymerase sigma factor [Streptomyces griseosporeus]|uniref:SigB/SigF/SigG family RNA polymerase sigma factor n=1 Tax=Streptomyces griseosporeus TaxID=1910 RepID=UPI0036FDF287